MSSVGDAPARKIVTGGRIVLSSGDIPYHPLFPNINGKANSALDFDVDQPALLRHPSGHPEGTYLLMDLALSHWPKKPDGKPMRRKPVSLIIHNGLCSRCSANRFRAISRIRRAKIEILYRRANNPDEEFVIPPARVVYSKEFSLPDSQEATEIKINPPLPEPSPEYPVNMNYIIGKLTVLDIYPGEVDPNAVAVGEVVYRDAPL